MNTEKGFAIFKYTSYKKIYSCYRQKPTSVPVSSKLKWKLYLKSFVVFVFFPPLRSCRSCLLAGQSALPQARCFPPCVSSTAFPLPDSGSYDRSNLECMFCKVTGMPLNQNWGYQNNTCCGCARAGNLFLPKCSPFSPSSSQQVLLFFKRLG